jgi:hypothetical protein
MDISRNTLGVNISEPVRDHSSAPRRRFEPTTWCINSNRLARQRRAGEQVGAAETWHRRPRRYSLDEQRGGRAQVVLVGQ